MHRTAAVVSFVFAGALGLSPAHGQVLLIEPQAPVEQTPTEQAPMEQAAPLNDSELRSFAVAALDVQRINNAVIPQLEAASSAEEQEQLAQVATNEKVRAVEAHGLSVEKYQEILRQAQTDPVVADRIVEHLQNESQ